MHILMKIDLKKQLRRTYLLSRFLDVLNGVLQGHWIRENYELLLRPPVTYKLNSAFRAFKTRETILYDLCI